MANFSWLVGTLLALLLTAALITAWWIGGLLYERWKTVILKAPWTPRPPLQIGSIKLLGTGWLRALLRIANRLGFLAWRILILGVYILLVVLVLPVWQDLPQTLWAFVRATAIAMGNSVWDYLPSLGRIVFIVVVARIVLAVFKYVFHEIRSGRIKLQHFDRSWATQTYNLIRFAAVVMTAILIFPLLPGSGSSGFQGIAIFVGALVSIGASTAVANAVAGIVLTYTKAFDRGDRVNIHDTVGDVVARSMFVTRVRTVKNEEIAIPNQLVLAGPIINYSQDAGGNGIAVEIRVGIGYDVPWRDVHKLLREAATMEGVLTEPEPRIFQSELGDFAVSYTLHAFVADPRSMAAARSAILQRIMDAFGAADIEILSPAHHAVRQGGPVLPGKPSGDTTPPDIAPDVPHDEALEAQNAAEEAGGAAGADAPNSAGDPPDAEMSSADELHDILPDAPPDAESIPAPDALQDRVADARAEDDKS